MFRFRCLPFVLAGFVACSTLFTREAPAELLSAEELKSCQLHVIGIYSPKNHSEDDRVFVTVKKTDQPMVLVLTGYFGAQWNLNIAEGADVRQIIVAGYFEHSLAETPDGIPTEFVTYFPKADKENSDYFWSYSWHTNNGRKLRTRLKEMTGLDITTFQGEYSGSLFLVDGKRGAITEHETSTDLTEPPQGNQQKINMLRQRGVAAKAQQQMLEDTYGDQHPAVQQVGRLVEMIQAELSRLGADPIPAGTKPVASANVPKVAGNNRSVIESLVRQSFELETQLQIARIEKAEADLKTIKQQLSQRQNSAEKIIKARVEELMKGGASEKQASASVPASVLSEEAWSAWRKRDLRSALAKFKTAVAQDPDEESARNGLGWTYLHLGEHAKAMDEFKTVLKDHPTHGGALNGLGHSLLMQGKLDEAERELLKATEDSIAARGEAEAVRLGITASWFGLVRTYLAKKDTARAKKWIDRYLKHKPNEKIMLAMQKQLEELENEKP